jgi:hypothetical protein
MKSIFMFAVEKARDEQRLMDFPVAELTLSFPELKLT